METPNELPIIHCPHCNECIIIEKLNCAIFRHGAFKQTGMQLNPHLAKELCDKYFNEATIYGCGKPFKVVVKDGVYVAERCDYI